MDVTEFRTQLESEKQSLLAAREVLDAEQGVTVAGRRSIDRDDASAQDPAEVGEQITGRSEVLTELRLLGAELVEVDAALERIAAGTYGRCETCKAPIDPARLRALPTARRCAADQRSLEEGPAFGRVSG